MRSKKNSRGNISTRKPVHKKKRKFPAHREETDENPSEEIPVRHGDFHEENDEITQVQNNGKHSRIDHSDVKDFTKCLQEERYSDVDSSETEDELSFRSPIELWQLAREYEARKGGQRQAMKLYEWALEKFGEVCLSMNDACEWVAYGECLLDAFWCTNDIELLRQAVQVVCRAIELDHRSEFAQPFLYLAQIHTLLAICNCDSEESCRRSCCDSLKYLKKCFHAFSVLSFKNIETTSSFSYPQDLIDIAIKSYSAQDPFSAASPPPLLLQLDSWLKYILTIYRASCLSAVSEERSHSLLQLCLDFLFQVKHILLEVKAKTQTIPAYIQVCQLNAHFLESRCLAGLVILFQKYFCEISHARRYCDLSLCSIKYCKNNLDFILDLIQDDPDISGNSQEIVAIKPNGENVEKKRKIYGKAKHEDIRQLFEVEKEKEADIVPSTYLCEEEKLTLKFFLQFQIQEIFLLSGDVKNIRSLLSSSEVDAQGWYQESILDYQQGLKLAPNDLTIKAKLHAALTRNNSDDEEQEESDDEYVEDHLEGEYRRDSDEMVDEDSSIDGSESDSDGDNIEEDLEAELCFLLDDIEEENK